MEKVAGLQYYSTVSTPLSATTAASAPSIERSAMIRGHHSSISKAVDAHRQMVEQRQSRNVGRRDLSMNANQPNSELFLAQQIAEDGTSTNNNSNYDEFENTLIESPSTQAKMASIQSFQSTEPDRPVIGEPVPKGSYLDVEA
ncbi:hypothetical protein K2X05_03125 [bacterium]|nr:hypothetical protein [bacterium]